MFTKEEEKLFLEYSLENEKNLRISINAGLSFNILRKTIIQKFVNSLDENLRNELGKLGDSWKIYNDISDNVFVRWKGMYVHKSEWNENYYIGFVSEFNNAKGFILGVSKNSDNTPTIPGLIDVINSRYKIGKSSSMWIWYQWLDHHYLNWDNEEVLILMNQSNNNDALKYFVQNIMNLVYISSDIIDEHIKKS